MRLNTKITVTFPNLGKVGEPLPDSLVMTDMSRNKNNKNPYSLLHATPNATKENSLFLRLYTVFSDLTV